MGKGQTGKKNQKIKKANWIKGDIVRKSQKQKDEEQRGEKN